MKKINKILLSLTTIASMTAPISLVSCSKTYEKYRKEILEQIKKYNELIVSLKELVQGDADAFYPLSQCYKMPRTTDEEKRLKREALEVNLYNAAMIPLQIMEKSYEALCLVDRLIRIGNQNLIGDVATGAVFLESALKGASLSVFANTSSMKNEENIKTINEKSMKLLKDGTELANKAFEEIFNGFVK